MQSTKSNLTFYLFHCNFLFSEFSIWMEHQIRLYYYTRHRLHFHVCIGTTLYCFTINVPYHELLYHENYTLYQYVIDINIETVINSRTVIFCPEISRARQSISNLTFFVLPRTLDICLCTKQYLFRFKC